MEEVFGSQGNYELNFIRVNAQERFYVKLAGVKEPERKRKIIGEEFIRVFEANRPLLSRTIMLEACRNVWILRRLLSP